MCVFVNAGKMLPMRKLGPDRLGQFSISFDGSRISKLLLSHSLSLSNMQMHINDNDNKIFYQIKGFVRESAHDEHDKR